VGVPLINEMLFPLASIAFTLSTITENEVTLAIGASVPTTNAEPVPADDPVELSELEMLLQPIATTAAAASEPMEISKDVVCFLGSISPLPLFGSCPLC
jgi:hypothetical protein